VSIDKPGVKRDVLLNQPRAPGQITYQVIEERQVKTPVVEYRRSRVSPPEASSPPANSSPPESPAAGPTPSSGGPRGLSGAVNTTGNVAGGLTRAFVPGVVEAELGLLGGAYYAAGSQVAKVLVSPLVTASEAVPIVGAGVVAGGVIGNIVQSKLSAHGAGTAVAATGGALAAGLTGAGVGALIGAPTGIGAPMGAAVGFAAGVTGYYLSKWF